MDRTQRTFESLETRRTLNAAPILLQQFADDDWRAAGQAGEQSRLELIRRQDLADDGEVFAVADLTADGVDDVLLQWPDGSLHLQINDGSQLFQVPWGQGPNVEAELLKLIDVNNDGLNDIVSFDRAQGDIWVSLNSVDGFTSEVWSNFTTQTDWLHMFVDDFDGDGLVDVLGGEAGGGWWLAKNAETTFHNHSWGRLSTFAWEDVVSGDFTGDGLPDVAARASDNTWWTWHGTSTQLATPVYWGHWKMGDAWHDVQVADFNADNVDDVIGRTEDGRLWVGTAKSDRFHTWKWGSGWAHAASWSDVSIIDVNGDQLPDQLGRAADNTWWYAENQGDGFTNRFLARHTGSTFVSANFVRAKAIDLTKTFNDLSGKSGDTNALFVIEDEPQVFVTVNDAGQLVMSGDNVELLGVDFQSESGSLIPNVDASRPNDASPFEFMLENARYQATFGGLNGVVLLNGSITFNVGWDFATGEQDLFAQWGGVEDGPPIYADVDDRLDGGVDRGLEVPALDIDDFEGINQSTYANLWS